MSRVHMGLKNGRMGLWTSPSGVDASGEGGRMTLNSDYDHLKIHASGQITLGYAYKDPMLGFYLFNAETITFPALPYIPLVFLSNSPPGLLSIIYPASYTDLYVFGGDDNVDKMSSIPYDVYHDKIALPDRGIFVEEEFVTYIVFKNKVA